MSEHNYQAATLYGMARRMQSKATRVILSHIATYSFLGAVVGVGVWMFGPKLLGGLAWFKAFAWWTSIPALAVLFGFEGYLRGRSVSSHLEFEAQRTLCQIKIEEHLAQIVVLLSSASSETMNHPSLSKTTENTISVVSTEQTHAITKPVENTTSTKDKKPQTGHRKKG